MGESARWRRLRTPAAVALGVVAATALVHVLDPNRPGSYGFCPFRALTGLACPLCGGLRAVHALTHGDLETAWGLNPAVVVLLPVTVAAWSWWVARSWSAPRPARGRLRARPAVRHTLPWVVLAGMFLYTVLRNLPALQPHLTALT